MSRALAAAARSARRSSIEVPTTFTSEYSHSRARDEKSMPLARNGLRKPGPHADSEHTATAAATAPGEREALAGMGGRELAHSKRTLAYSECTGVS
jgi:hypothetical protein